MRKILVLDKLGDPLTYEREAIVGFDDALIVNSEAKSEDEIIKEGADAEVILFVSAKLTRRVIENLRCCKLMIRYGIGYDTCDTTAAREAGIMVCNAPNYGVVDVAEHAFSLMLACAKRLVAMNDRVRDNNWGGENLGKSSRLSGKTVGFLGFGKIARAVCSFTAPFGTSTIVYDPYVKAETIAEYGAESVSLDKLLSESDFLTLHLPLSDATRHTIGKNELALMKPTAILINTSRGPIVDEAALIDALDNGVIAGAGLDVFEDESGGLDRRILTQKNVVLTPHVAWNTAEAVVAIRKEVAGNLAKYLSGARPDSIVNGL